MLAFWTAIIILGPAYRFTHQGSEGGFLYAYFACFDGIAIGCCAAVLAKRISLRCLATTATQALVVGAMAFLYLCQSIAQTNVLGVTAMALGTSILLLGAHRHPSGPILERLRVLRGVGWIGRLSYELYLFHLIVLGAMRTVFPPYAVVGDDKLLLLAAFFLLSIAVGVGVARFYGEPLNRVDRRHVAPHFGSASIG